GDDFKDTEDLDGVFSGLQASDPAATGQLNTYANASWQYKRRPVGEAGRAGNPAQTGENSGVPTGTAPQAGGQAPGDANSGPPFDALVQSLVPQQPEERDETLQDPRTAFQIVRRHYARYTPEMVERVTGCP